MALNIKSTLTTKEGIPVENAYVRVIAQDGPSGTHIGIVLETFVNASAFENGLNTFEPTQFDKVFASDYNRETDGVDVLSFAHQKAVEYLTSKGVTAEILLT